MGPARARLDARGVTTILDVQPAIAAGQEPFPEIMNGLRALPKGAVLTVLAPFEPAPLIRLMGGRGWRTHVAWDGETCRASFWMPPTQGEVASAPAVTRLRKDRRACTLDVRGLEPREPLRLTLGALDDPANLPLTVLHTREPALLFPKLQERGLAWEITHEGDEVRIRIHAP
ncbi:MAG: DUF2249 domain-containing protein [Thermomonas sp.]|nr:DUF2249 domain-containing protein [Thermomonas sp.]